MGAFLEKIGLSFKEADKNQDGQISRKEWLQAEGVVDKEAWEELFDELLEYDQDEDGSLEKAELKTAVTPAQEARLLATAEHARLLV